MSWSPPPTEEQLRSFFAKFRDWRATLTESEQRLVDSMVDAALGLPGESASGRLAPDSESGRGEPVACSEFGGGCWSVAGWLGTPWGMSYTVRYW